MWGNTPRLKHRKAKKHISSKTVLRMARRKKVQRQYGIIA